MDQSVTNDPLPSNFQIPITVYKKTKIYSQTDVLRITVITWPYMGMLSVGTWGYGLHVNVYLCILICGIESRTLLCFATCVLNKTYLKLSVVWCSYKRVLIHHFGNKDKTAKANHGMMGDFNSGREDWTSNIECLEHSTSVVHQHTSWLGILKLLPNQPQRHLLNWSNSGPSISIFLNCARVWLQHAIPKGRWNNVWIHRWSMTAIRTLHKFEATLDDMLRDRLSVKSG